MQQIKNGHSNKYFIEIAASVRIGKYSSRSFLRIFCTSPAVRSMNLQKKKLDQYIFLQYRPHASSVAYKCEQAVAP